MFSLSRLFSFAVITPYWSLFRATDPKFFGHDLFPGAALCNIRGNYVDILTRRVVVVLWQLYWSADAAQLACRLPQQQYPKEPQTRYLLWHFRLTRLLFCPFLTMRIQCVNRKKPPFCSFHSNFFYTSASRYIIFHSASSIHNMQISSDVLRFIVSLLIVYFK